MVLVKVWLSIKFRNITFDDTVASDIKELHQLIDEAENNSTDNVSPDSGQA